MIDLKRPSFTSSILSPEFLSNRFVHGLILVLGVICYFNAIFHPFVHDDVVFIRLNPYIADLNFKHVFEQTAFGDPKFPLVNAYYRPLLEIFNRLQYAVFGFNPWGYHLTNIVLHIENAFLLFLTLRLLFQKTGFVLRDKKHEWMALGISLIFLVHPVQSEAVASIAGISNVLTMTLGLCVMYFYLKTIENEKRSEKFWCYVLSLFFLVLGLLCKEQTIVVPVLIIWLECWFGIFRKDKLLRRILMISGYILTVLAYFIFRKILFGHPLNALAGTEGELYMRLLSIPRMILIHLKLLIWPSGLHYYRCIDILLPKVLPWIVFILTALATALTITFLRPPFKKMAVFGLGWFAICLGPTLNFIPLVNEYSLLLLAEHFLYIPMAGFFIFFLCIIENALDQKEQARILIQNVFIVVLLVWSVQTIYQNHFWRSEIDLFKRTVRFEKDFGRAHILLAKAYAYEHNESKSFEHYNEAQKIFEGYVAKVQDGDIKTIYNRFLKEILTDKAHLYEAKGELAPAAELYQKALSLTPKDDIIYFNLGVSYAKLGQLQNATLAFENGLKVNPNNLMMTNALALCYKELGRRDEARTLLETIVKKDPSSQSAKDNLNNFLKENP